MIFVSRERASIWRQIDQGEARLHLRLLVDRIEPLTAVVVKFSSLRDGPRSEEKVLIVGQLNLLLVTLG